MIRKTDRMDIYIEEYSNAILLREKWRYVWDANGFNPWTYEEKLHFHSKADNIIWQIWGKKIKLKVTGTSDFANRNCNKQIDVKFDIQWVLTNAHWEVIVKKIPKGNFLQSSLEWGNRRINLDSEDVKYRQEIHQIPVAHEFGHAVGNIPFQGMHGDEYLPTSSFFSDKKSIMNEGVTVRNRHIDYLIMELNKMILKTKFEVL